MTGWLFRSTGYQGNLDSSSRLITFKSYLIFFPQVIWRTDDRFITLVNFMTYFTFFHIIISLFLPQLVYLFCHISCYDSFQISFITLSLIFKKFFEISKFSKKLSSKFINCSATVKVYTEKNLVSYFFWF